MPSPSFSRADAIRLAACHTCCSMRGEPCRFNRSEDPEGRRSAVRLSHQDRVIRAKKIFASIHTLPVDL